MNPRYILTIATVAILFALLIGGHPMTALHWVRNDKSPAWILRPVAPCAGGYLDLLTRSTWTHAQPISEGHLDAEIDAQLAQEYAHGGDRARTTEAQRDSRVFHGREWMNWQPIEIFPSEGSQSILPCLILFSWSDIPHVAKRRFGKWFIAWDEYEIIDQLAITHWMPLPPPPESTT